MKKKWEKILADVEHDRKWYEGADVVELPLPTPEQHERILKWASKIRIERIHGENLTVTEEDTQALKGAMMGESGLRRPTSVRIDGWTRYKRGTFSGLEVIGEIDEKSGDRQFLFRRRNLMFEKDEPALSIPESDVKALITFLSELVR